MTRSNTLKTMSLGIHYWITTVVNGLPFSGDRRSPDAHERVSTSLYVCQSCQVTYISAELSSCPQCDNAVEQTPTASELGFDSADSMQD